LSSAGQTIIRQLPGRSCAIFSPNCRPSASRPSSTPPMASGPSMATRLTPLGLNIPCGLRSTRQRLLPRCRCLGRGGPSGSIQARNGPTYGTESPVSI
jgi:hypothetical protein